MNEKQKKSLFSLASRLHKQKFPALLIAVIVVASLFVSNDSFQNFLFPIAPNECKVLKVYDGDTITLQCHGESEKTRVRMYCIDTPEIQQKPWGIESRDHLRSIVGETVKLVKVDKDRYGRIVGEVYSGELNLNLAQVKAGKAAVYDAYCKKLDEYKPAENKAKEAKLGIWSQAGSQQEPWAWRKEKRSK